MLYEKLSEAIPCLYMYKKKLAVQKKVQVVVLSMHWEYRCSKNADSVLLLYLKLVLKPKVKLLLFNHWSSWDIFKDFFNE